MRLTQFVVALAFIGGGAAAGDQRKPSGPSKADQLASAIREACRALTTSTEDMHRVAEQLGSLKSEDKNDIVVAPSKLTFSTIHVRSSEVEFELAVADGVTVAQLQKRFGTVKEDHSETYIPAPTWDANSSARPTSAAQPHVSIDFRRIPGSGDSTCMLSATVVRAGKLAERTVLSISVTH